MLNKNSDDNNHQRDVDAMAESEAEEGRRQGNELIENHLSHHMQQNPDSSYVTWIACLHPENADVTIDQRFLIPGNPWWTVYEGAKGEIPVATATPVVASNHDEVAVTATSPPTSTSLQETGTGKNPATTTAPIPQDVSKEATGIDLVVGCILSMIALLTVFIMEAVAYGIYWISTGFYTLAQTLDPPSALTGIIYSICLLIYYTLALVDSCLLIASVLVTELVALVLFMLSCLFAGCNMAKQWHQYLRRTCHLTRWAFRSKSLSSNPPRHLCLVCLPKEDYQQQPPEAEENKQDKGDKQEKQQHIEGEHQWVEPATAPHHAKEDWLETGTGTSATPTAPPIEEHDVIVLDESNVFVDHPDNLNDSAGKNKEDHKWW